MCRRRSTARSRACPAGSAPEELGGATEVGGRVLEADDAGHLREPQHGLVAEVGDGAAGHVVQEHRQVDLLGDRAEMAVQAFLRRLVVVGDDRQRHVGADGLGVRRVSSIASAVEFEPVPAMTGTRFATSSTAVRMSRQCSSRSTVGDSPVVPTMTIPAVPLATWNSMSRPSAGRSSAPPSCIGVAIATRLPVSMGGLRSETAILPHSTGAGPAVVQPAAGIAARPGARGADGGEPLDHGRAARGVDAALLERDHGRARRRRQSPAVRPGASRKSGIRRPAVGLVAAREGLVEQHARRGERRGQRREQRPVQVVGDDDRVEALAARAARRRLRDRPRGSSRRARRPAPPAPTASRSTAVTRAPRAAKKRACRPRPQARSSSRAPGGTSGAKRVDPRRWGEIGVHRRSLGFVGSWLRAAVVTAAAAGCRRRRRSRRRLVGEPGDERGDVGALARVRRDDRRSSRAPSRSASGTARRAGRRAACATIIGSAPERDALPADGGLDRPGRRA